MRNKGNEYDERRFVLAKVRLSFISQGGRAVEEKRKKYTTEGGGEEINKILEKCQRQPVDDLIGDTRRSAGKKQHSCKLRF